MPKYKLSKISEVTDLAGKRVLLRTSLNVPVTDGVVSNQFRLMRGLVTINFLREKGAKVIMIGHLSNNKAAEHEESMKPVYDALSSSIPLRFCTDVTGPDVKNCIDDMKDGDVVLLENLRRDPREKKNDPDFARSLADLADLFVNDGFDVAHREHASVVGVPAFLPSYVGLNFFHEYDELEKALAPQNPSLFLLGGAKFDTKMPLVEKFLSIYDHIFIGGALANDFFKAKGYEIGTSLVSDIDMRTNSLVNHEKILLPVDVTVQGPSGIRISLPNEVQDDERILDSGPETILMLKEHIEKAKMVLWNGPFGDYEHGFSKATEDCARVIGGSDCYSVVGGGDTVASIASLNMQDKFNFMSTAGGAMLSFLENGSLPAIDALQENNV